MTRATGAPAAGHRVLVPVERMARWVENFEVRHGGAVLSVDSALSGTAADGSTFTAALPFSRSYDGPPELAPYLAAASAPGTWGVLIVRRGGFAVARLAGAEMADHKIGRRHVQGRTKAGGQSQQRFARRRSNQARVAFEAAADHAARILPAPCPVVAGGDRAAVLEVLADSRLAGLARVGEWLDIPDPRRAELDRAIRDAMAIVVYVTNA